MTEPDNGPIALPTIACQLPAALTDHANIVGQSALLTLDASARRKLTAVLDDIRLQTSLAATVLLDDLDADDAALPELLVVRAWLLAVAAGAQRLGATEPPPNPGAPSGVAELRRRYQDDLAGAEQDGVLGLIDDLLEL